MKDQLKFAAFLLVFLSLQAAAQNILRVGPKHPYRTIQAAINAAKEFDTVLVAPGKYLENLDINKNNVTVRSEMGPWSTIIDGCAAGAVVRIRDSILEGFTLTNGVGGVHTWTGYPTIRNNIITGNRAPKGAGILAEGRPNIFDNIISGNTATSTASQEGGGAIYWSKGIPVITRNLIAENHAEGDGGGILGLYYGTISLNVIARNSARRSGGGIALNKARAIDMIGNNIVHNAAGGNGGGVYMESAYGFITNNTLAGNSCGVDGGGIHLKNGSSAAAINTILWNNRAKGAGPELWMGSGCPTCYATSLDIRHSVVHGGLNSVYKDTLSTLRWDAPTMWTFDPLFADEAAGDTHLLARSPCIDAGDPGAAKLPGTDFEGDPRTTFEGVDIGADEYHVHLYTSGTTAPGKTFHIKVIGPPQAPVVLGLSLHPWLRSPPLVLPGYGGLYLGDPIYILAADRIPSTGVFKIPVSLPPGFPAPRNFPIQALAGYQLTNPCEVLVK